MINNYKFPKETVPNREKDSPEFGKKYAEAIWNIWEHQLTKNKAEFEENRKYAAGNHPIDVCKDNIAKNYIEESYLHIDWKDKINLLPRLLRKVYNSVDMKEFSPVVFALDPSAREEKSKRKNEKMDLFYNRDFLTQMAEANGGVSEIPLDKIPESAEQVELEESTEPSLSIETAEELVLQSVCNENDYPLMQKDQMSDLIEPGIAATSIETCPINGIKLRRIEPERFIHAKTTSKHFKDCRYFGEERFLTIAQLKNIAAESGMVITEEELKKMVMYTNLHDVNEDETLIRCLAYSFKTFHEKVYKKKVGRDTNIIKIIDRTDDVGTEKEYKPNPNYKSDVSEKLTEAYDVWYEGIMILEGDKKIIRHRLIENMPEYKGKIIPPYVACAPRMNKDGYNSIVSEVKQRIISIQELRYRIVHQRNRLKGTITKIDKDMLSKVKLGNKLLSPKEVLSFFFSLDMAFTSSMDEDGEPTNTNTPISEVPAVIPYALRELMTQFFEDVRLLDESFGYIGFDQQKPDEKTLFPTEVYRLSDNVQMKDYVDAMYTMTVDTLQVISSRINDIFKYSEIREKYISMIGTDDVEILEKYKNRDSHYFGIYQDIIPTRQERLTLMTNVNAYVQQSLLDPLDGEEILNIRNKKIALRILRLKLDKRKKEDQDFQIKKANEMNNGNTASTIAKGEQDRLTLQLESQIKEKQLLMQYELDMQAFEREMLSKNLDQKQRDETKVAMEQMRMDFNAQLTNLKKDRDEASRLKAIEASGRKDQALIKIRNGEINDISEDRQSAVPELNLSN